MPSDAKHVPSVSVRGERPAVSTVTVNADIANGISECAVRGRWDHRLGIDVCAALRDCLDMRMRVILVDLHGLADENAASVPLWLAVRRAAAVQRPAARIALCLPPDTVLHDRLRFLGSQSLSLYTSMAEARTALARPPIDPA